jgi:hypothetical protein
MVWGFCYLRIFKKMHSISGRSLVEFGKIAVLPGGGGK